MMEVLGNGILFAFVENYDRNTKLFKKTTDWGFESTAELSTGSQCAKWGKVIGTGPKASDVEVGEFVLIESLQWTNGFTHDGVTIWKTDISKVLAATKEQPEL